MTNDLKPAIDRLEQQRAGQLADVAETEKAINTLCKLSGLPEPYAVRTAETSAALTSIKDDTFYGRPFATVVREYLVMRRGAGLGPASVNEIYDTLIRGGYQFETKNEDNAKRGIRISLTKNVVFHKLPSGSYGLSEWYPAAKAKKAANGSEPEAEDADEPEVAQAASKPLQLAAPPTEPQPRKRARIEVDE